MNSLLNKVGNFQSIYVATSLLQYTCMGVFPLGTLDSGLRMAGFLLPLLLPLLCP